jgi:hypothetical protein
MGAHIADSDISSEEFEAFAKHFRGGAVVDKLHPLITTSSEIRQYHINMVNPDKGSSCLSRSGHPFWYLSMAEKREIADMWTEAWLNRRDEFIRAFRLQKLE